MDHQEGDNKGPIPQRPMVYASLTLTYHACTMIAGGPFLDPSQRRGKVCGERGPGEGLGTEDRFCRGPRRHHGRGMYVFVTHARASN